MLRAFKWSYLSAVIHAASHIVVIGALARFVSPRDVGLLNLALIFTSFAERVGQIGIGPALVQRDELTETHVRVGSTLSLLMGLLIFTLLAALSPAVETFFREPALGEVLRAVSAIFVIEAVGMVSESLLQRQLRFKALLFVDNISYLIGTGAVSITLAYLGYGVWALVFGTLAQRAIKSGMLLCLAPAKFSLTLPRKEAVELVNVGMGFSLGRILNYAALQGDNFVVGRALGAASLGIYANAYKLMTIPATYFGQVLDRVLFPAFAKRQNERAIVRSIYLHAVEAVAFVAMPATVFMYLLAPEIVGVLLGPNWTSVVPVFELLSLGVFFRTAYKTSDTVIRALGAVYRHAGRQALYTACVVGGALLGCTWDLRGVAVAVMAAVGINYVSLAALSASLLNLRAKDFVRPHLPALWASLVLCGSLFVALPYLRSAIDVQWLRLAAATCIAGISVCAAACLAPRPFRLGSMSWAVTHVKWERMGRPGALARRVVARCA